MMFNVEMFPADYGDCLWITYGTEQEQHQILIDGGTEESASHLLERIRKLPDERRRFELFVITHVDSDHIGGALSLLREADTIGVTFDDVWFNGWKHIRPLDLTDIEGELLTENIRRLKLNWNKAFDGTVIKVPEEGDLPMCQLPGGMKLTVLSPTQGKLDKLAERWYKVVTGAGLIPGQVKDVEPEGLLLDDELVKMEKLLAAKFRGDGAVANGSSISLLAEYDGKRCLLAADAFPSVMVASLKRLRQQEGSAKIRLGAFKLSHHGSRANTNKALLDLVDCRRYLFSSNGKQFGHPHRETVARVIKFGGDRPTLYFNYRTPINNVWDDEGLREDLDYRVEYGSEIVEGSLVVEL